MNFHPLYTILTLFYCHLYFFSLILRSTSDIEFIQAHFHKTYALNKKGCHLKVTPFTAPLLPYSVVHSLIYINITSYQPVLVFQFYYIFFFSHWRQLFSLLKFDRANKYRDIIKYDYPRTESKKARRLSREPVEWDAGMVYKMKW